CRIELALIAYRELRRPAARNRHEPKVVPSRDIRDEDNRLAIGRPRRISDLAGHVQAVERKSLFALLDVGIWLGGNLLGVGDCFGWGEDLRDRYRAHSYDDNKSHRAHSDQFRTDARLTGAEWRKVVPAPNIGRR